MPSAPANAQCVVAGQPSSSPASAARNAPVQTLTTRRACSAAVWIQAMTSRLLSRRVDARNRRAARRVSTGWRGSGSGWATSASPVPVVTGSPSTEATMTS